MGDPFSVAGTTVGIISLGIQTCQILYKYCSDFKSFPHDVELVQRQIKGLQGILEGLYEVKGRLEIDNHVPSSQLNMALKECEETLHELKQMAEKRNPASASKGIQTKVRTMKERALWSYKKEDLKEVQSSLARFQSNLSLALQCAGLDGALRRLEDLRSELEIQRQQVVKLEQTLSQGTEVLEMIRRDVASQNPTLSTIYREIVSLRVQLAESSASKDDSHSLNDSDSSSHELIHAPSETGIASRHKEDPGISHELAHRQRSIRTRQPYLCRCRQRRKHQLDSRGWYKVVTDEAYDHSKDCPQSTHGDYTRSVAVQLSMYNSLLRFCVQIGWQHSRRDGWNSPAPVLRYRAVVASDSPVFALLARKSLEIRNHEANAGDVSAVLSSTASQLRQIFGKTASPTDLDEHGNGILYAVLCLIQNLIYTDAVQIAISELIDACFYEGVPFDETDADGHYPVVHWQLIADSINFFENESRKRHIQTLFHLTQKVKSWSVVRSRMLRNARIPDISLGSREHVFFSCVSDLLRLESCSEGFYEDDPLREVILRRSETDFLAIMKTHDGDVGMHLDFETMALLASWPRGLHMLFSCLREDIPKEMSGILLNFVVAFSSPESIANSLTQGAPVTWNTWWFATNRLYDARFFQGEEIFNEKRTLLWIQISEMIATRIDRSHETITTGSGHNDIIPTALSLYHARSLTCISAESAWRAGHRELNLINPAVTSEQRSWYTYGTPLWIHASRLIRLAPLFDSQFELLIWLFRHGADPSWTHPTHLTTPAHLLGRRLFASALLKDQWREDVSAFVSSELRDSCYCRCSQFGCSVVGCTVAKLRAWLPEDHDLRKSLNFILKMTLKQVFMVVKNDNSTKWMAADIIRVMTFDELSLTHTCCYPLHDRSSHEFTRTSPEETEEIHDHERDEIDLLEEVAAELEEERAQYNKSFLSFMNRVWRPRMRKMHDDQQVDTVSYEAQLVNMGISLKRQDQGNDSDTENYESWPDESEDADSEGWYTTDEDADEA